MRPKLKYDEVERLKLQFRRVDKNNDGKIDVNEFREFLKETFPHANTKDLEEMMPAALGDGDDAKIDITQYVEFMSQDSSMRFDVRFIRYQAKIWNDRLGLVTYIPFLALFIFFLVTGKGLGSSYWMQNAVIDHVERRSFQNSPDQRYYKAYADIGQLSEFWDWNDWPMINTIWPKDGEPGSAPVNRVDFPIGAMKLRQIRIAPKSCPGSVTNILDAASHELTLLQRESRLRDYRIFCYPELTDGSIDKANYPVQTYRVNNSFGEMVDGIIRLDASHFLDPWERDNLFQAYRYRTAAETNGTSASLFFGKVNTYGASGHTMIVPFSYTREEAMRVFDVMMNGIQVGGWPDPTTGKPAEPTNIPWIDHATRGISVEFITYNQNLGLVAKFQQFIEITAGGALVPLHNTITFPFFNLATHGAGYFTLLVIFILMILVQCYTWLQMVNTGRQRYVMDSGKSGIAVHLMGIFMVLTSSFWVLFDATNLILFLVAWALRFYWMSLSFTSTSVLTLDWYPKDWETVGDLVLVLSHIDAVNALLTFLRVFYFLRLNSQLNLLTKTIGKAKAELMGIVFIFLIVFIGFALMAFVVFGTVLEGYRDFSTTVSSLLLMLLGSFDYTELKEQRRVFAPILFAVFNVLANFLLLNMVIAVLNQAFEEVQNTKYKPGKVQVLLESINDEVTEDPFIEKMARRQKGLQNWIRGTSLWRELVYGCNIMNLYTKSKSELPGGEDEWEARLREAKEYNPRTFWKLQENMMFFQKKSMVFQDKLKVNPMPLKFHLLDEFGEDLKCVIDLKQYVMGTTPNHLNLSDHDLVLAPAYCTGTDPRQALLELMDYFHTWKSNIASNYAFLEDEELQFEEAETKGIAIRGAQGVEDVINKETMEWRSDWDNLDEKDKRKMGGQMEEMSRYEKERRQAEKEEYERVFEKIQLDEQTQHIENLQRRLDDMHSTVAGSVHKGAVRIDAKDVLIPTNITISSAPELTGHNPNGVYTRKGMLNGKPYWKKLQLDEERDQDLCIVWGDGKWWVGKPRKYAYDRVCVPSLLTWEDARTNLPPTGACDSTDSSVVLCTWETVMDGGIGHPPELSYNIEPDGTVPVVTVTKATTHQVNGEYLLQQDKENGKSFWRKRYQPIVRYFKVEPFPGEPERTSVVRAVLRGKRDEIAEKYNVTLRVPGELASRERRMQIEGDWHMCALAYDEVMSTARDAADEEGLIAEDAEDDEVLPEVFMADGHEVSEATRQKKVEAVKPGTCTTPQEWEHAGTGYDLDLMWKEGRWVISRRLAESNRGYVGFHEMHPKVSLVLCAETGKGSPRDAKERWEAFIKDIPRLLARFSRSDLLVSGQSVNSDGVQAVDQGKGVFMKVKPRKLKVAPTEGALEQQAENDSFFEEMCSYYKEKKASAQGERAVGRDAMLFGIVFEDEFRQYDNSTAEVLIPSGRLKGTWLECTIVDVPDTSAHAKYRCDVDLKTSLESSSLVLHQEYYKDYIAKPGRATTIRTIHVTREHIRKRPAQDAESWVSRFVSWVNNPKHEIHQEYPGLLSATKILNPSPQSLYFCEDPDTRYHPPLFPESWKTSTGAEHNGVVLTGTTRVHLKRSGTGGIDREPLYLSLHHAYTVSEWELIDGKAEVFQGPDIDHLQPSGESWSAPCKVCAVVVGDWLHKYNAQEGLPIGEWVRKTDQWEHVPSKANQQWTRDFRDDQSLYVCVHRWKNEASIWELERAPERGTKMFLRKTPVHTGETDGKNMIATNYPLSYKGDGKKRYLSVFSSDKRLASGCKWRILREMSLPSLCCLR
eukprot:TRINITY_DN16109_c0_g3_i2.p1 TRINITY_DN16109_c0_g3~~TRINITY_DN16109_c0_g3_i2.p1  ORF type:complete len:1786 (+),score=662.51 TRINITY_DN16109_c0_g3_i2:73-5430(+)